MVRDLVSESRAIAEASGFAPPDAFMRWVGSTLTETGSTFTASMARDIENHNPIEADHIIGDLILRGEETGSLAHGTSLLRLAYTHLKAYEAREKRSRIRSLTPCAAP